MTTATKYKTYPKYKSSGIDWLGDIPDGWEVRRIKMLCKVSRGASPRPIDDEKYFDDNGEYFWVRIADLTASDRYLETTTQRLSNLGKNLSVPLEPGEIFLSIAGTVGSPIITKIKCCIHDGFVYFMNLKYNRELLWYIFIAGEAYKGLGKLGTQLNLNTDTVGNISIPVMSKKEQQEILAFLDHETAKIDKMVTKKQKMIELLKEKRQALITHAVTKGLDPKAKMKSSGIDWLGDIPKGWEVKKLKYLCGIQTGNKDTVDAVSDGDFPFFVRSQTIERINSYTFDCEAVLTAGDGVGVVKYFYMIMENLIFIKECICLISSKK